MRDFEKFLDKINFKKAFKVYFGTSILILLLCGAAITYITRDKIKIAIDYKRISENFEHKASISSLKAQLDKLSIDSADILNIIAVDKDNSIVYKANSNLIGENNKFLLVPYNENKQYLQDRINEDIVYKIVRKENVILNRDYIKNHERILSDIDQDFYFEKGLGSQKIELLNFMVNRNSGEKIFIIRTATSIPYVGRLIKITGGFIALIGMIYWIALALWVYRDANRKNCNPALWGFFILVTNLVGLIIYVMYKQNSIVCQKCSTLQNRDNAFCTTCGTQINELCGNCCNVVSKNDHYCNKCGNKLLNRS